MAETNEKKVGRAREESKETQVPTSTSQSVSQQTTQMNTPSYTPSQTAITPQPPQVPTQVTPPQTISPTVPTPSLTPEELQTREKIGEVLTELIFASQEVALALALCECPQKQNCELVSKTKDLIQRLKKLIELQKGLMRRPR